MLMGKKTTMEHFKIDLSHYTPPVLLELADHIRAFADQLDRQANDNELRLIERRNHQGHKRSVRAASEYFCKLVEDGTGTDKALDLAAARFCVQPQAIKMTVTLFKAKQRNIEKIKRDRKIMLKYRAGLRPSAIARSLGCSKRTIERVIAEFREV